MWLPKIGLTEPLKAIGWRWPDRNGKRAFDSFMLDLVSLSQNDSSYSKYVKNYMKHAGKKLSSSFSDIFYLPKRLVADWLILTNLMLKHEVFLEIGFSVATLSLTSTTTSQEVVALTGENWSGRDLTISLYDKSDMEYYHRINHRSRLHQYFVEAMVKRSLITSSSTR
ncbi:unnamed protein product [Rotaria sp. Silwood2]|nr:unnamed protein product [Rotaria sp. Silwood2]CAF3056112.1 unnamed protein product [Rotaria sp. Silwood2]CAF3354332.1 unnamed protein product [Rotaria sp. Silwood2]CAF4265516.1 unnamed protein product [Rotaria sp. Silwood2]CAF4317396.1 unnamed protein product [Rotaria sp. Silwood2]